MLAPTVVRPLPRAKQRRHDPILFDATIRALAKEWFMNLSPGSRKVPPLAKLFGQAPAANKSAWSRARNGCVTNPIYRMCVLLHDCKLAGVSRTKALQLLVQLRLVVDMLWPLDEVDDLPVLLVREQRAESAGDVFTATILPHLDTATVKELERARADLMAERSCEDDLVIAFSREIDRRKRATLPASSVTRRTASHRPSRTARI